MRTRTRLLACLAAAVLAVGTPGLALATESLPDQDATAVSDASMDGSMAGGEAAGAGSDVDKLAVPTVDKEISADGGKTWGDVVDVGSFSRLSYRVTGTLPEYVESYDKYYYAFVDRHDASISVDQSTVAVELVHAPKASSEDDGGSGDAAGVVREDVTGRFSVSVEGEVMTVACDDLRAAFPEMESSWHFVLTYEASVGRDADLGFANPNENSCHVSYLREGGVVDDTPDDVTFAYGYAVDVSKAEKGTTNMLQGAVFAVRDEGGRWLSDEGWTTDEGGRKTFSTDKSGLVSVSALSVGTYELVEVSAPEGYARCEPVRFVIRRDSEGDENRLLAGAEGGKVTSVSARDGRVGLLVEDERSSKSPDERPGTTGGSGSGVGSSPSRAGGGGGLVKTGDVTSVALVAGLFGAGVVVTLVGVGSRRRES